MFRPVYEKPNKMAGKKEAPMHYKTPTWHSHGFYFADRPRPLDGIHLDDADGATGCISDVTEDMTRAMNIPGYDCIAAI